MSSAYEKYSKRKNYSAIIQISKDSTKVTKLLKDTRIISVEKFIFIHVHSSVRQFTLE